MADDYEEEEEELTELQEWEACEKFRQALKKGVPRPAIVAQMSALDLDESLLDAPRPDPPQDDEEEWYEEGEEDDEIAEDERGEEEEEEEEAVAAAAAATASTGMLDGIVMDSVAYERRMLLLFEAEKDYLRFTLRAEAAEDLQRVRDEAAVAAGEKSGAEPTEGLAELEAQCQAARAEAEVATASAATAEAARGELQEQLELQRSAYDTLRSEHEAGGTAAAAAEAAEAAAPVPAADLSRGGAAAATFIWGGWGARSSTLSKGLLALACVGSCDGWRTTTPSGVPSPSGSVTSS